MQGTPAIHTECAELHPRLEVAVQPLEKQLPSQFLALDRELGALHYSTKVAPLQCQLGLDLGSFEFGPLQPLVDCALGQLVEACLPETQLSGLEHRLDPVPDDAPVG